MQFQIEQDIEAALRAGMAEYLITMEYAASTRGTVQTVLGKYSRKVIAALMVEVEEIGQQNGYGSTADEVVRNCAEKHFEKWAEAKRVELATEFKAVKEAVLNEGYTLVNYRADGKTYYGMAKPFEPTIFMPSEFEAVMQVKPCEEISQTATAVMGHE